jgi:hypothetical protein
LNTKQPEKTGNVKVKKRTLWSSKNSVSHKPLKKKKPRQENTSHSPRNEERHVYFEYSTPSKNKKFKLGQTQDFTQKRGSSDGRIQSASYGTLGNFNQQFSESKRTPKEFRIQRSHRSKGGSKGKVRPPLYSNLPSGKHNEISAKLLR